MWNIEGKTVIITGATNGIGKVTALELAKQGAKVVIVGRNPQKTAATVAEIEENTGVKVTSYLADLSKLSDVRAVGEKIAADHPRIDVLINNAGAFYNTRQRSADGLEMTFALNHISYFVLTYFLLPSLQQAANTHGEARIINVSSGIHGFFKLNMDDLQSERGRYSAFATYARSKLLNLHFTYELARRLARTNITVNALHPGFVNSGFSLGQGGVFPTLMHAAAPLMKALRVMITPEEGAKTTVYLAQSQEVSGMSGAYFENSKRAQSSASSHDEATAKQVWSISENIAGIEYQL